MGISALPASTVRQLGSTQCLTDPASIVKELVENSLDADATAIFVEISSDTIGKIKVKDNGYGIAHEDRSMACKRYHTSKIRDLEDLHGLGGQSLGFRGEALASAADMSAKLVLTTRSKGEPNAVEINYNRAGFVESEKPTFHAVGTTVEVHHFLSNLPVRKQTAEKASTKCLLKTKKLLQAYALARPWVRLSLKVLKAKNEKGDWSYSPKGGARNNAVFKYSTLDAAMNVFGRKAAEQLQLYSFIWSPTGELIKSGGDGTSEPEAEVKDRYKIDLLVVSSSITDTTYINNLGTHISIDARPVSCHRGILKVIYHYYKSCLRSTISDNEIRKIIDPISIMNISCPNGSYDINVDRAKDEVLFTDANIVLQVCQKSLDSIYGKLEISVQQRSSSEITPDKGVFNALLAKRTVDRASSAAKDTLRPAGAVISGPTPHSELSQSARATTMVTGDEQSPRSFRHVPTTENRVDLLDDQDEVNFLAGKDSTRKASGCRDDRPNTANFKACSNFTQLETDPASEDDDLRDIQISNPRAFAKIHTPVRPLMRKDKTHDDKSAMDYLPTPKWHQGDVTGEHLSSFERPLMPPNPSPMPFPYPIKAFNKRKPDKPIIETSKSTQVFDGPGVLDSWLHESRYDAMVGPKVHDNNDMLNGHQHPLDPEAGKKGTALRDIPNVSQRLRQVPAGRKEQISTNDQSQNSPSTNPETVWFDIGNSSYSPQFQKGPFKNRPRRKSINLRDEDGNMEVPAAIMHPDLAISLDYEARKAKATQDHREHLRREKAAALARRHTSTAQQRTLDSLLRPCAPQANQNSPHKNRQRKAVAQLHAHPESSPDEADDALHPCAGTKTPPSKYLLKALPPPPLERVTKQDWTSDLILPLSTTHAAIAIQMQEAANWDDYVHSGDHNTPGLDEPEASSFAAWEGRVRHLVGKMYRKGGDPHVEDGRILGAEDFAFAPRSVFRA